MNWGVDRLLGTTPLSRTPHLRTAARRIYRGTWAVSLRHQWLWRAGRGSVSQYLSGQRGEPLLSSSWWVLADLRQHLQRRVEQRLCKPHYADGVSRGRF